MGACLHLYFSETVILVLSLSHSSFHIFQAVGYPFDIIKTRIQAAPQHQGIYTTALELVREANGIGGLYRGFGLKLVRAIPASMVGFLTYETVAGFIRSKSE